jgi:metal-responsive CopG/Arc/MetJ family transcriptional regulator
MCPRLLVCWYDCGYTFDMKTAISLPDDLFSAADALAGRLGVSRSQLYATALAEFLSKHDERQITGLLDQVYGSEDSALDNDVHRAQRQSLGPDEW